MSKYQMLYEVAIDHIQELEDTVYTLEQELDKTKRILDQCYKSFTDQRLFMSNINCKEEIN